MDKLKERINALVDGVALKLNDLLSRFDDKEDKSNKKSHLDSTNGDHYPSIPAVNAGLLDAIATAEGFTADQISGIITLLADKVDKDGDKMLTDENFTSTLKQKLEEMESSKFRGAYNTLADLIAEYPESSVASWHKNEGGWYADVGVENEDSVRFIWDKNDYAWIESGLAGLTPEQVKQLLLENEDTFVLTQLLLTKLTDIESNAQKNVQSKWGQNVISEDDYIIGKPTKLSDFQNDPASDFPSKQWVKDRYDSDALNWDEAVDLMHSHDNQTELDKVQDGDVYKWDEAHGWGDFREFGLGEYRNYDSASIFNFDSIDTNSKSSFLGLNGVFFDIANSNRPQGILSKGYFDNLWSWYGITERGPLRMYIANEENKAEEDIAEVWHDKNLTKGLPEDLTDKTSRLVIWDGKTIANHAESVASDVINDIEIGGVNLIRADKKAYRFDNSAHTIKNYKIILNTPNNEVTMFYTDIVNSDSFTVSFKATDNSVKMRVYAFIENPDISGYNSSRNLSDPVDQRFVTSGETFSIHPDTKYLGFGTTSSAVQNTASSYPYELYDIKLESKGIKTDFNPNPLDQASDMMQTDAQAFNFVKNKNEWGDARYAPIDGYPDWAQQLEDLLNF